MGEGLQCCRSSPGKICNDRGGGSSAMLQTFPLGRKSAMLQSFRGKVCNVANLPEGKSARGKVCNTTPALSSDAGRLGHCNRVMAQSTSFLVI